MLQFYYAKDIFDKKKFVQWFMATQREEKPQKIASSKHYQKWHVYSSKIDINAKIMFSYKACIYNLIWEKFRNI